MQVPVDGKTPGRSLSVQPLKTAVLVALAIASAIFVLEFFIIGAVPVGLRLGLFYLWVFSFLVVFATLPVALSGRSRTCRDCGAWFTTKLHSSRVVDTKRCYGVVSRKSSSWTLARLFGRSQAVWSVAETRHSGFASGLTSTVREERAPVIQTTRKLTYGCSRCGATSHKEKVEQVEDFERA